MKSKLRISQTYISTLLQLLSQLTIIMITSRGKLRQLDVTKYEKNNRAAYHSYTSIINHHSLVL